jgi:hypothetical protein
MRRVKVEALAWGSQPARLAARCLRDDFSFRGIGSVRVPQGADVFLKEAEYRRR